ncbi:hypothetical protein KPL37_17550 [Clostridium frigoris]|uniref:DICT domain-containing protein n=1 Tax=Clostridium frigoris TaxID=205327 RepID=A0ABS6BY53_9CLOT|nr:DICT sensory domain-containing protein [Clostridium frigoris]MBU3161515.1 hypothetical protein [Clostridium frigoris]
MNNFSIYEEIFKSSNEDFIKMSNKESDKTLSIPNIKYESKVANLAKMCFLMESVVLNKKREGTIYAGFQKISRASKIWDRFLQMADNVDKIYIFGEKDTTLKSHRNIEFIYLPHNHKLIKEWFLVMDIKFGKNMMVAYDLDGFGTLEIEEDRNFKGVKTFNIKNIDDTIKLLKTII